MMLFLEIGAGLAQNYIAQEQPLPRMEVKRLVRTEGQNT